MIRRLSDKRANPAMRFRTTVLGLVLAAGACAAAQPADPLQTAACGQALAALQAGRAAASPPAGVEHLRDEAARACLRSATRPSRPARVLQAPIVVPPPVVVPPADLPAAVQAPLLPPPVAIERPPLPALCDPSGCWTIDGGQLRHRAPNLTIPAGPCRVEGAVVYCP